LDWDEFSAAGADGDLQNVQCNADRISSGCALPQMADEPTQSAAQLSQWALGARFLWFISG
jgi:hypothetical protein